jgi:glycosyltransferase involved in cell wall biosynthesis
VTAGDAADLSGALDWMAAHPQESEKMGRAARAVFEERYTAERNFAQLLDIYRDVV